VRERRPDDGSPEAALAFRASPLEPTAEEGDAAAIDAVTELRQQGGKHGQGAEHCDRDNDRGCLSHAHECPLAGDEHRSHRDDHGQPRGKNCFAGGGCCDRNRTLVRIAPCAFLAGASVIEE
jgi:hypothetical protein